MLSYTKNESEKIAIFIGLLNAIYIVEINISYPPFLLLY